MKFISKSEKLLTHTHKANPYTHLVNITYRLCCYRSVDNLLDCRIHLCRHIFFRKSQEYNQDHMNKRRILNQHKNCITFGTCNIFDNAFTKHKPACTSKYSHNINMITTTYRLCCYISVRKLPDCHIHLYQHIFFWKSQEYNRDHMNKQTILHQQNMMQHIPCFSMMFSSEYFGFLIHDTYMHKQTAHSDFLNIT